MKYQAQIKRVNGDIITVIWDDDRERFLEEVELARQDIVAYLGDSGSKYANEKLYIEIV